MMVNAVPYKKLNAAKPSHPSELPGHWGAPCQATTARAIAIQYGCSPWSARFARDGWLGPQQVTPRWLIRQAPEGLSPSDSIADGGFLLHLLDSLRQLRKVGTTLSGEDAGFGLLPARTRLEWTDRTRRFELLLGAAADGGGRYARIGNERLVVNGAALDMLDLTYSDVSRYSEAPLQLKANGGVLLVDDFGRQRMRPQDLLNRWIVPLEKRYDFLSLPSGKKIQVPFDQLIIFSTNLEPRELVDDAFLRRIRHKVRIEAPDRATYSEIFRLLCQQKQIQFSQAAIELLFRKYYHAGRVPRSSDPRDLLEIADSICKFHEQPFALTEGLMDESARRFFQL